MKKVITLFATILLLVVGATAQKLSYQTVVRNDANELLAETTVQVAVMVLDASNAVQYSEIHVNVQTNRNGLLSLMIGDGISMGNTTLADVEWPGASLRTIITLPDNTTITNVTPVNSVPYALYADNVNPDMVSDAIAEYIANHNIGGEDNVQADWNESDQNSDAYIWNKPDIPTIPTNVSAFANDAGYLTEAQCNGVDICSLLNMVAALQQQVDNQNADIAHLNYVIDTLTFHCGTSTVTDHEGNVYNTVQIGNQCWMKENLRTTTSPSTGTYLVNNQFTSGTNVAYTYTGKMARWYNNDSATYAPMNYGLLYNWNAAVDTFNTAYGETSVNTSNSNAVSVTFSGHRRGICPVGWHLPSDAEWNTMEATVSGSEWQTSYETTIDWRGNHAGKLAGGDNWTSSTTSGAPGDYSNAERNVSGFSAVPAGYCFGSSFYGAGLSAAFWSATQYASYPYYAYYRSLYYHLAGVDRRNYGKDYGYSVRCLRDNIPTGDTPTPQDTTVTPSDTTITPTDTTNTSYGIPCPGTPTVTDHEGNVYNTVQIGNQCWTKENLRTTTSPSTGTYLIPAAGTGYTHTGKQAFWYDNDSATYALMNYGLLYNWNAAVDTFNTAYGETSVNTDENNAVSVTFSGHRRGICPAGWHLPSDAEWTMMEATVSGSDWQTSYETESYRGSHAGKLAGGDSWWYDEDTELGAPGDYSNADRNASGFSAVPAGDYEGSSFYAAGGSAYFWSSTQNGIAYAYSRGLDFYVAGVGWFNDGKDYGYSVRCLRDSIPSGGDTPAPQDTTNTPVDTTTTDGQPCPGTPTVTDHEGNVYNTVQIGDQCWTKENLRTTTSPSTGTYLIPAADANYTYTGKQAFWYNNDQATYAPMNYGLLYNWNAAVDTFNTAYGETSVNTDESNAVSVTFSGHRRGICPAGWHLPSDAEWTQLTDYVSSQSEYTCDSDSIYIAKALASTEGWDTYLDNCVVGNNPSANNATGFSAVPAGFCFGSSFDNAGANAYFWSATQDASYPNDAYDRALDYYDAYVSRGYSDEYYGRSVRCLRDSIPSGGDTPVPQDTTNTPVDTTTTDGQPCPGTPTVTDHEGNVYATVQIGDQCWMRDNLRTTTSPSTGTYLIPAASATHTFTGKQARWYNNDPATYAPMNYGLLYNWNAAVDTFNTAYGETSVNTNSDNAEPVTFNGHRRGICPAGWHLPSDAEWTAMTDYVSSQSQYVCGGNTSYIAKALADSVGCNSYSGTCYVGNDQSSNNATGFSAVPAGDCGDSSFGNAANGAYFWSSSQYESGPYYAWSRSLHCYYANVHRSCNYKYNGRSVRCLRD